jgi:hypothetical protein
MSEAGSPDMARISLAPVGLPRSHAHAMSSDHVELHDPPPDARPRRPGRDP